MNPDGSESEPAAFCVNAPADAPAAGRFSIGGTLNLLFDRAVDEFGSTTFSLANSTPNLLVNGNDKVHVPVTALSSQVDDMLWSNAAIWNDRFLPVDVSGTHERERPRLGNPNHEPERPILD